MASVPLPRRVAERPPPEWMQEIRPHQVKAIDEVVYEFNNGAQVVILEAPTGSGKTLIGERVADTLGLKTLYVCSDKALMDQFGRDFKTAKLLKGRANYPTQNEGTKTADDCTSTGGPDSMCWYCDAQSTCPYQIAKQEALRAPLACTNTSYFLTEANYVGKFSGQQLVIADEADTLEGMLMGFVEYKVGARRIKDLGMGVPGKGIHKATLVKWLREFSIKIAQRVHELTKQNHDDPARVVKQLRRLAQLREDTERVAGELQKEVDKGTNSEGEGKWLRIYDKDRDAGLCLKPVMVDGYGTRQLWRHSRKWLLMSATIISADEIADSLGLPLRWSLVKVPSTFPIANRPVIMAPVANVVYKEMDKAVPLLIKAIVAVMHKHPEDRVLVHTVSYRLAEQLTDGVRQEWRAQGGRGRKILTYQTGSGKDRVMEEYRDTPGCVMFACSMGRGVDLPDDACRVQVIAKVPFMSLGDTQVSRRMHLAGGQQWFVVQAIRDIVQMTGRAVRSETDWCITYVFDKQFAVNLYRKHESLFPTWWKDAVITNRSIREFL